NMNLSPRVLEGRKIYELFEEEHLRPLIPACEAALGNERRSFVLSYENRTLEVTVSPISQWGRVTGCIASGHNISHHLSQYQRLEREHERSEYTLREYERLLSSTFKAIEDTLLVVDGKYTVVMSNIQRETVVPYERCYGILAGRETPCPECQLMDVFRTGEHHVSDFFLEETRKHKRVLMHPIYDEGGATELVVVHQQDITEQRENEKNLRRLTETLESQIDERTYELERTIYQLENEIAQRKKIEEKRKFLLKDLKLANKELESFSYTISHDLRAPLRNIKGYSAVLREDFMQQLGEEGREYVRRIEAGSQKMEGLIEAILTLSRLDRRKINFVSVDLSELFAKSAEGLHEENPEREVQSYIEPGLKVWGDKGLLSILARNLMENAWKYTSHEKAAEIRFGLIRRDKKKIFYLSDNGVGFDMESANQLFQPFRRLHSESEFPGIGVGLATVRRIILRHGGDVWAIGRKDRGATFYFTIFPKSEGENDE
ncbi:MAG: sensor histidine kinase, partial [Spirochaetaceae bacterium]